MSDIRVTLKTGEVVEAAVDTGKSAVEVFNELKSFMANLDIDENFTFDLNSGTTVRHGAIAAAELLAIR